jgi:hypothetical protein
MRSNPCLLQMGLTPNVDSGHSDLELVGNCLWKERIREALPTSELGKLQRLLLTEGSVLKHEMYFIMLGKGIV